MDSERKGGNVRIVILFGILAMAAQPLMGQLYSYRNKEGKLVITDRPLKKEGYKLVDKYIPKEMRERQRQEQADRQRRQRQRTGKYVLTAAQIDGLVTPLAKAMKVDSDLVKAVIQIESSRDARAHSHKGAMGLMQLIPETAKRFGVKNPWDPRQNVKGGILYLRYLLSYFRGNVDYVLAAYNAGENAVDKHGGIPPYKETRNYVKKIRRLYKAKKLPYDMAVAKYPSSLVKRASAAKKAPLKRVASAE